MAYRRLFVCGLVLLLGLLAGCGSKDKFVGKWEATHYIIQETPSKSVSTALPGDVPNMDMVITKAHGRYAVQKAFEPTSYPATLQQGKLSYFTRSRVRYELIYDAKTDRLMEYPRESGDPCPISFRYRHAGK